MDSLDAHVPSRRRCGRVAAMTAGAVIALGATGVPAHAAVTITPTDDAAQVAKAILDNPASFTGASFTTRPLDPESGDPPTVDAKTAAIGLPDAGTAFSGFPLSGADFGVLSTGDPTIVTSPNDSEDAGLELADPDGLATQRGESVHDATTLKIDFTVPPGADCLALSYRFLSEEFPEFVGSRFNDAFVAELDKTTWTTDASQEILVPDDFATKAGGKPVSVNGVGPTAVSTAEAAGTTFDAATGLVTSKTPVTPGAHSVYLSIFDQSDHIYDSMVMLDRLGFLSESATTCKPPEVPVIVPPPPAPPAPPGPEPKPAPSNSFTVPGGSVTFSHGSATITIQVPGPGVVTAADSTAAGASRAAAAAAAAAAGKKHKKKPKAKALVKPAKAVVTKAGPVKLKIKPTKAGMKVLRKKHKLKVKLAITFTPTGGTPSTQVKTVTIKLEKKKKKKKKKHKH